MATPVFATVIIPMKSGLIDDAVMNTFSFILPGDTPAVAQMDDLNEMIASFYAATNVPQAYPVSGQMSFSINRSGPSCHILWYDISNDGVPGMGAPIYETFFDIGVDPVSTTSYVPEVAVTLSLVAAAPGVPEHGAGGTRPKARYRGRLYIGPWNQTAFASGGVGNDVFVDGGLVDKLCLAANRLHNEANGIGASWGIWSRKDALVRPVIGGWVDNAPDIQRRRGIDPTVRTLWGSQQALASTLPAVATKSAQRVGSEATSA